MLLFMYKKNLFIRFLYEFNFVDMYIVNMYIVLRKSAVPHFAWIISFLDRDKDVFNKILERQNPRNYSPLTQKKILTFKMFRLLSDAE